MLAVVTKKPDMSPLDAALADNESSHEYSGKSACVEQQDQEADVLQAVCNDCTVGLDERKSESQTASNHEGSDCVLLDEYLLDALLTFDKINVVFLPESYLDDPKKTYYECKYFKWHKLRPKKYPGKKCCIKLPRVVHSGPCKDWNHWDGVAYCDTTKQSSKWSYDHLRTILFWNVEGLSG